MLLLKDPIIRDALIIVVSTGCALLFFHMYNKDKRVEDFYRSYSIWQYYVLKLVVTILFVTFGFNVRFLANTCLKKGSQMIMSKLLMKMGKPRLR